MKHHPVALLTARKLFDEFVRLHRSRDANLPAASATRLVPMFIPLPTGRPAPMFTPLPTDPPSSTEKSPPPPPPPKTSRQVKLMAFVSKERLQHLKREAEASIPSSPPGGGGIAPFVSTNDALVARLIQVLGRLDARGVPTGRAMCATLAVDLRPRLKREPIDAAAAATAAGSASVGGPIGISDGRSQPDGSLFLDMRTMGNWSTPVKTASMDPLASTLGQLATAVRASITSAPDQGAWDLRALDEMATKPPPHAVVDDPQPLDPQPLDPVIVVPNFDIMSLESMINTTTWEWRADRLAGFSSPGGCRRPPTFHTESLAPGGPARNVVVIVRAMSDDARLDGGRMVTMLLSDSAAEEIVSKDLQI